MSHVKTDKLSARTASGTITLGESGETFSLPSGTTLSAASGATVDLTNATKTGFPATSLEVIKTVTNPSDSATIDVTNVFSASYGTYAIHMTGLYPTSTANIYFEMGNPDLATGVWADLPYFMVGYSVQSSATSAGGYATSYAIIGKSAVPYATAATTTSYWMWIFNPYNQDVRTAGKFDGSSWDNTANYMMNCEGGFIQRLGTVGNFRSTDFRIRASTGNMEGRPEAKIVVYGVEGT
jgi:hypothetical protein